MKHPREDIMRAALYAMYVDMRKGCTLAGVCYQRPRNGPIC